MRRAPIVLLATVLGTAGVLLFKPLPTSTGAGGTEPATSGATSEASATSSASSSGSSATKTAVGAVETDRYGETQVKVTFTSGRITDVAVLKYNDDDPRSAQISQSAIPTLRTEVLTAQSAAVDTVSGATYTSNAYEASLQSALDKLGFTAANATRADTDLAAADATIQGP